MASFLKNLPNVYHDKNNHENYYSQQEWLLFKFGNSTPNTKFKKDISEKKYIIKKLKDLNIKQITGRGKANMNMIKVTKTSIVQHNDDQAPKECKMCNSDNYSTNSIDWGWNIPNSYENRFFCIFFFVYIN